MEHKLKGVRISRAKKEEWRKNKEALKGKITTRIATEFELDDVLNMKVGNTGIAGLSDFSPLWELKEAFIAEQSARDNSSVTIKDYERGINKLFQVLAYNQTVTREDLDKVKARATEKNQKPEVFYGSLLPIYTLQMIGDIDTLFMDYLKEVDGLEKDSTLLHYKRSYRAFMYYAMDRELIKRRNIKVKEAMPTIHDVYTDEEIRKLLKAPLDDDFNSLRDWTIINYLLGTGNRVSSVVALNIGDIDFDDNRIWVYKQKNRKPILIALTKQLRSVLKLYIASFRTYDDNDDKIRATEPLFPTWQNERMKVEGLQRAVARYNKSRGVDKTSIHLFRHTFAKKWIMSGGDLISLQQMLGHTSLKMVQHYANLWGKDIQEKADKHALLQQFPRRTGKTIKKNHLKN